MQVEAILTIAGGCRGVLLGMENKGNSNKGAPGTKADHGMFNKAGLATEVIELQGQNRKLRSELIKAQIIAATRLDVIRLLGFMMNRDPAPDPMVIAPKEPEVRTIVAGELDDLAKHLRERADQMNVAANKLREPTEEDGSRESS